MAVSSKNVRQEYQLAGRKYNAPIEWPDARIIAEYENDSVQPSINIENFQFALEAREAILQWIADGRIFEGMPLKLTLFNNTPVQDNFGSILDFTRGVIDFPDDGLIEVGIAEENGIDSFFNNIDVLTFGYLEEIGFITNSDYTTMDYVVEKKFNLFEIITTSIVIYLMIKELSEAIARTAEQIATIAGILAAGISGSVGSAIYAVAVALVNIAYTAAIIVIIIDLGNTLLQTFLPPRREHKVFNFFKMLDKVCQYYGYNFVTSVDEFSSLNYLPSNQNQDEKSGLGFISKTKGTQKGIPESGDYGYNCGEIFQLAKRLCDGKVAIIGNEVHLRPKNDPFWIQNSTYEYPNVLLTQKTYNLEDLKAFRNLVFAIDLNDEHTIDDKFGREVEIRTDLINVQNNNNNLLKGKSEVRFNVALASRKDNLNAIEKLLKAAGNAIDQTASIIGQRTNFANKIKSRVGLPKQSSNWNSVPKLIYLNGNTMPTNHRSLFNAQLLFNKYYGEESFVQNNFAGQKAVYQNVEVPFGFEDYKKLTQNSYFKFKGQDAKIIKFEWTIGADKAVIDFWVREVYTRNLKETQIVLQ